MEEVGEGEGEGEKSFVQEAGRMFGKYRVDGLGSESSQI